jgi:hypothetical protein
MMISGNSSGFLTNTYTIVFSSDVFCAGGSGGIVGVACVGALMKIIR